MTNTRPSTIRAADTPSTSLRVAVTGGTSGLGLALVHDLHRQGARVAFVARGAERVARVAREHPGSHGIVGDVSSKGEAFVDEATLRRADEALRAHGCRTHEFGDSVLIARADRMERLTEVGSGSVSIHDSDLSTGDARWRTA